MNSFSQKFPLLLAISPNKYYGFLNIGDQDFRIYISLPKGKDSLEGIEIKGSWKFHSLLLPSLSLIKQRIQTTNSLEAFLTELQSILEQRIKEKQDLPSDLSPTSNVATSARFYRAVLQQLEEIGWDNIHKVHPDLSTVVLAAYDDAGRRHLLELKFSLHFPEVGPSCSADLPEPFLPCWSKSLLSLFEEFCLFLGTYQILWGLLDELDSRAWVLEPPQPFPRKYLHRRIALGESISLHLELNTSQPGDIPAYTFLGPEINIGPLRERFQRNASKWNPDRSLADNLEEVLEMPLPTLQNSEIQDLNLDCGICYGYRLDDELPDKHCEDSKCRQPFHQSCLYEWLKALPTTRHSFNTLFGSCPYCNKSIACGVP